MSGDAPIAETVAQAPANGPLGILSGSGVAPAAVAQLVVKGGRPVVMFGFRGFAEPAAIERFSHEWIALGQFSRFKRLARRHRCRDFIWVGGLVRPRITQLRFDFGTIMMLPDLFRAYRGGDNHMLTTLGAFFERHGFDILAIQDVAPQLLAPEGAITSRTPSPQDRADIERGLDLIDSISRFDIGQAVLVAGNHVLAVEGIEGTDEMLRRAADLRRAGRIRSKEKTGVLVKIPKRGQDLRFDLPTIGPDTIANLAAAGLGGIAIAAGKTIVVDIDRVIAEADRAGLFIVGVESRDR